MTYGTNIAVAQSRKLDARKNQFNRGHGSHTNRCRIQRSANGKVIVLTLSGRIKEADFTELQKTAGEAGDHSLTLDLKEPRLVDRDVIGVVAGCKARGVNIVNCPAYIQKRVESEVHETANKCYHTIVGQNFKIFTPWLGAIRWRALAT